ncbi:HSP20-like chaperone, partial [Decorospora gaudefroyi]
TRRSSHHHEPAFSPDFDLRETPEAYFLEGEFPGISGRNALKLQWIDGCTLRVQGTIRKTDLKEEWGSWLNERRDGMYVRNFSFPAPVNTDAIQARLSRGLLRIMVPKTDR